MEFTKTNEKQMSEIAENLLEQLEDLITDSTEEVNLEKATYESHTKIYNFIYKKIAKNMITSIK